MHQQSSKVKLAGFTLVEVVISISITAVLMMALWSLLTMYLDVSARSERRVMRSQLIRAIQQQIEADLQNAYFRPERSVALPLPAIDPSFDDAMSNLESEVGAADSVAYDSEGPTFSSSFDDVDLNENDNSVDGDVIFALSNELWMQSDVALYGNSYGLVMDHTFRPQPKRDFRMSQKQSEGAIEPTPPTEVLSRTVYLFVDREEALVKGLPPGLLRITLLPKELERIRQDSTTDLFQVVQHVKPELFKQTEFTLAWQDDTQVKDARTIALEELNRSLGRSHLFEHDFTNRIDYVPEVESFRLRFFDGESWSDQWDAKRTKALPVAVELSFEIDMDLPTNMEEDFAKLTEDFTFEDLQADELAESESSLSDVDAMNLDSDIRSAQTVAYVPPNQFLIHLRTTAAESSANLNEDEFSEYDEATAESESSPFR